MGKGNDQGKSVHLLFFDDILLFKSVREGEGV